MKFLFQLIGLSLLCATLSQVSAQSKNVVCFYNSTNHLAGGLAEFSLQSLEESLELCTHVVYGYAGIKPDTFQLTSLNEPLDIQRGHFAAVTALKDKYPHIKFLLSVGGDQDLQNVGKYIKLLEAGRIKQRNFIESARELLRYYNFDGLDLAFQLPRNKPRKVHTPLAIAWKGFKKLFTGNFVVDKKAAEHREQFTALVQDIKLAFEPHQLMLTLTVLPNVNSSWYYNAPAIINNLDFVNLAAFDFLTPDRNPEEADFTAPLYGPIGQNRLPHYSVNLQVEYWLLQRVPAYKINVGIPTYGRVWKMTQKSGNNGLPVVAATNGAVPAGRLSRTNGIWNYVEIFFETRNPFTTLTRVVDPDKRYNPYIFAPIDDSHDYGVWISYDDPESAAHKAAYTKMKNLGGVALFDLTNDDFLGQCTRQSYPILRAIKHGLE